MKKSKKSGSPGNKTIGQKITSSILSASVLCSVVIGLIGLIGIAIVNQTSQQVYKENLVPLKPIYHAQADFQSVRSNLKSFALEKSSGYLSGTDYKKAIEDLWTDIDKQIVLYETGISSQEEQENFDTINSDLKQYKAVVSNIIGLIDKGQVQSAVKNMDENSKVGDAVKSSISKAFTLNTDQAESRDRNSSVLFYSAIIAVAFFTAAFILVSVKRGKRIALGISTPIGKMVEAAEAIAQGRLDADLSITSTDETGTLARSFTKIVDSLGRLKSDVHMLIGEAMEGRLDTRADVEKHNGDYKEIIAGVNEMFDTIKVPLDVTSAFVNRLADGEHQEPIENTYKGYYRTLVDNLNKVRQSVATLVTESEKLAQAGLAGNLEVRGDEGLLKGVYARIIRGVNETFDAIKMPLDASSQFISALSKGDEKLEPLENKYKGYYASLVTNLNGVLHAIRILVGESEKLTQAGSRGDLTVRGDTGALSGSYANIISGFNETIESIVLPLDEASAVLRRMAVNDFTVKVEGSYAGMLKEFAASVNDVMATLQRIEEVFVKITKGDVSMYERYNAIGHRSENDRMLPAMISMMKAIRDMIDEANGLAAAADDGNLRIRGEEGRFEGGYREIIAGINRMMGAVVTPIEEASQVLSQLAQGDLTRTMTGEYRGEYNKIKTSMNQAIASFNEVLGEISAAASQVAAGAKQVSDGSQSLSQGAAEQASSVEELTSTVTEVASQTKSNATDAAQASRLSAAAQAQTNEGNSKMEEMLGSMRAINESSANISKIIKVIDDIAFQTNILALNAAVEAARAGQYGKGFAVVAEEVRNLAAKSAQAAKNTTALIEGSISKVEAGQDIANQTADMLKKVSQSIRESAELVGNIAEASNEQATAIAQIDRGILQVSTVVQTNSATAEESAASSEELSGQADLLMRMVGKFRLSDSGTIGDRQISVPETQDPGQALPSGASGHYGKY